MVCKYCKLFRCPLSINLILDFKSLSLARGGLFQSNPFKIGLSMSSESADAAADADDDLENYDREER